MALKVAVASNDGQLINEHFGRAKHFLIFRLLDEHFILSEVREVESPHTTITQHDEEALDKMIKSLSDCYLVLADQIGAGAITLLRQNGIKSFAVSGSIRQALDKLAVSFEVKNYLRVRSDGIGNEKN